MTGDFATPALELGRLGSLACCFGVPWDGSRLSSNLGLGFTGMGRCACGSAARGKWGLVEAAGCVAGKTWLRGLGMGDCWRYDGSTN